jgi:nucleoside-diphosphate-sugar epimerase
MGIVLVTGNTGFIGLSLAMKLKFYGYKVIGFSSSSNNSDTNCIHVQGNLDDNEIIEQLMQKYKPEIVIHLAGNRDRISCEIGAYRKSINNNLLGTLNLIEACLGNSRLERFIYLGSCEEYGVGDSPYKENQRELPISPYSYSKVASTHLLQTLFRAHDLPCTILRPSLVYGPGQNTDMFLPALIISLLNNKPFPMSGGEQTRDYIYIDDLVDTCISAVTANNIFGEIINIASGCDISIKEIAILTAKKVGYGNENLIKFGDMSYRKNDIMKYNVDTSSAIKLLKFHPKMSLENGIEKTVNSYRNA